MVSNRGVRLDRILSKMNVVPIATAVVIETSRCCVTMLYFEVYQTLTQ